MHRAACRIRPLPRRRRTRPRNASRSRRQLQLTWWRFRRHKLAVVSRIVVVLFYLVVDLRRFPRHHADPHDTDARRSFIPPQAIHLFDDDWSSARMSYGLKGARDPRTFKLAYAPDPARKVRSGCSSKATRTTCSACSRPTSI